MALPKRSFLLWRSAAIHYTVMYTRSAVATYGCIGWLYLVFTLRVNTKGTLVRSATAAPRVCQTYFVSSEAKLSSVSYYITGASPRSPEGELTPSQDLVTNRNTRSGSAATQLSIYFLTLVFITIIMDTKPDALRPIGA